MVSKHPLMICTVVCCIPAQLCGYPDYMHTTIQLSKEPEVFTNDIEKLHGKVSKVKEQFKVSTYERSLQKNKAPNLNAEIEIKYGVKDTPLRNFDLTSNIISISTRRSLLDCLRECSISATCVSFSYLSLRTSCHLFHLVSFISSGILPLHDGWKTYLIKGCPIGWRRFERSCYLFDGISLQTWWNAQIYCKTKDAYLAEIQSAEENDFLKSIASSLSESSIGLNPLTGASGFWVGGNDIAFEGVWIWSNSDTPVIFDGWRIREPNDLLNEDCMILLTGFEYQWADYLCGDRQNFICEKSID